MIISSFESDRERPETVRNGQKLRPFESLSFGGFWNIKQLCMELGISERSWRRMRADGRAPAVTWIGGRQVVSSRSLEEWVRDWTEQRGLPGCVGPRQA